ncbi:hypothetical protein Vadar_014307 [Vaccinium darrowii]|uniref:Uncharacterized protein n=1 Tax=Vaccinium darrowii TaxID=229202 RepID=A0ACB7YLM0_9ERIC|nr:hypothetical protein Vadar_014307 [Vaccinium darrowii]
MNKKVEDSIGHSTMTMDVDDVETLEMFGEGPIASDNNLADSDFYNSFKDEFDFVRSGNDDENDGGSGGSDII